MLLQEKLLLERLIVVVVWLWCGGRYYVLGVGVVSLEGVEPPLWGRSMGLGGWDLCRGVYFLELILLLAADLLNECLGNTEYREESE